MSTGGASEISSCLVATVYTVRMGSFCFAASAPLHSSERKKYQTTHIKSTNLLPCLSSSASEKCLFKTKFCGSINNRATRLTQFCTQFKSPGAKIRCGCICIIMKHSHLNDMEIPVPKLFIPTGLNWVQH